jgi:uncharacterized membrane protein YfcA
LSAHISKDALVAVIIAVLIYVVIWLLYQPPLTDVEPAHPPPALTATPAGSR